METKDQLVSHIKEWISIDEEVKLLKKEIKIRQERKKNLTQDLVLLYQQRIKRSQFQIIH